MSIVQQRRDAVDARIILLCATVAFSAACVLFGAPPWVIPTGFVVIMFPAFLIQWNDWRKSGSRWGGP